MAEKRLIKKLPTGSTSEDGVWWEKHATRRDIIEKVDEIIEVLNALIKESQTADVTVVVEGKWKHETCDTYHCSVCDYVDAFPHLDDRVRFHKYCPNCGAHMEEKK